VVQRIAIVTGAARGIGRVGQPADVAHAISFLVSEGAGFTSGQVIYVAGGPLC
jgi:3-oxoacyl-[acyl-carrier protein] reductase